MAKKTSKARKARKARKANKTNLSGMDFEALVNLRKQVEDRLHEHRSSLERQLASWGGSIASLAGGRGKMKGRKVAPKYRSSEGETWAGRGAKPRWLAAALKEGKKLESFLIDKTGGKGKRKSKA
jgi:DNA-binding protein H-NS